jgi:hypothetical protein
MPLHLTKVAFQAKSLAEMHGWFATRGEEALLTTRYLPKRHAEIIPGGSLFWIFKSQLVARSEILRFQDAENGRTHIVISTRLIDVFPIPCRAHQGWRYLEDTNAPRDLAPGEDASAAIPGKLAGELARLGLV